MSSSSITTSTLDSANGNFPHGSFQISTEQVSSSQTDVSEILTIGDEQVRIDGARNRAAPHFRAVQLNEFTSWLNNNQLEPDHSNESTATTNHENDIANDKQFISPPVAEPSPSNQKKYRFDSPTAKRKGTNENTITKAPHFATGDYVGDEREIQRIINQLKSDGRVIGDATQASIEPAFALAAAPLQWPEVTSQLLGSPAILNLEMNVQNTMNGYGNQLVVTSARQGAGATTVAMTLARQLAVHGKKTLLVDGNLSEANMGQRLGIKNHPSWLQTISERNSLMENVIADQNSPVSILPLRPIENRVRWPRKIYDELAKIIDSISWQFDMIVYDVGTTNQLLAEVSSPLVLGSTMLLVGGQNGMNNVDLQIAQAGLEAAGVTNMLIIQNFTPLNQAKVG